MISTEPEAATECQDLMGMNFRNYHFDGMVRVPSYTAWLMDTVIRETYEYHQQVLKLLQWHCKPILRHLRTPVHRVRPRRLRRGLPKCEIPVEPPRSGEGADVGVQSHRLRPQLEQRPQGSARTWRRAVGVVGEGVRAAHGLPEEVGRRPLRRRVFADWQADSVKTAADSYESLGLTFTDAGRAKVQQWADGHQPCQHGTHAYESADYGLTEGHVREAFGEYLETYDASA